MGDRRAEGSTALLGPFLALYGDRAPVGGVAVPRLRHGLRGHLADRGGQYSDRPRSECVGDECGHLATDIGPVVVVDGEGVQLGVA